MGIFNDIPVRSNQETIDASWFNTIRSKLISAFGDVVGEIQQDINNNASTAVAIASAVYNSLQATQVEIKYHLFRNDDAEKRSSSGVLYLQFHNNVWRLREGEIVGEDHGLTWSVTQVTAGGGGEEVTLEYSSDNMTGGNYSGKLKYKSNTFGVFS